MSSITKKFSDCAVLATGFDKSLDLNSIWIIFQRCGHVRYVKFLKNTNKKTKSLVLVEFYHKLEAVKAIDELNNTVIQNNALRVFRANPITCSCKIPIRGCWACLTDSMEV